MIPSSATHSAIFIPLIEFLVLQHIYRFLFVQRRNSIFTLSLRPCVAPTASVRFLIVRLFRFSSANCVPLRQREGNGVTQTGSRACAYKPWQRRGPRNEIGRRRRRAVG